LIAYPDFLTFDLRCILRRTMVSSSLAPKNPVNYNPVGSESGIVTMVVRFEENSRIPTRALQIYQVLVGLAWNRQTITYGALSRHQMEGYGTGGILAGPLSCIMTWCRENGLEPLTVLVVNDATGVPGEGLTTVPLRDWPAAQQKVFDFNWFSIMPPSLPELEEAYRRSSG
jgi:hypothetical protein